MDFNTMIQYVFIACASLIAVTLHEVSHGYTAYLLGDHTAKNQGRLTLNPIKHIDLLGLLALIVIHIGWAKPVPINENNFRNRKKGMILVSIAGPGMNFLLAFLFGMLLKTFYSSNTYLWMFLYYSMYINIALAIFNLLPLPPLDGSKLLASFLPQKWEAIFYKYEKYVYFIVLIAVFLGALDVILYPAIDFMINLIVVVV